MLDARKTLNEPLCESDFLWPFHVPVFFLPVNHGPTVGRPKHSVEEGGQASSIHGTKTAKHSRQDGFANKRSPACVVCG